MMTVMDYATMTTTGNTKANLANQFNKLSSLCVSICDDIQCRYYNCFLTLRNNSYSLNWAITRIHTKEKHGWMMFRAFMT